MLPSDYNRQIANIVRFGEISDVDMSTKPPMVRVVVDKDVKSDWMPYAQACIGDFYIWSPPTVGTHGILVSEGGENEVCRFIPSFNNEGNTPALTGDDFEIHLKNGDVITHNSETGDMTIQVTGNLTINAQKDVIVNATQNISLNAEENIEINAKDCISLNAKTIQSNAETKQIHTAPDITLDTPMLTITGSISQGGGVSGRSAKSLQPATFANFSSPMHINNTLTTTNTITTSSSITASGKIYSASAVAAREVDLETHQHTEVQKGGALSGKPEKAQ